MLERAILDVESFAGDTSGLLDALIPNSHLLKPFEPRLRQGVVLFSMTALQQKLIEHPEIADTLLPVPSLQAASMRSAVRDEALRTASVVFRTWAALAFMRPDDILAALNNISMPNPHLRSFLALAADPEVRHIRNAISHGTFDAGMEAMRYVDRDYTAEILYAQLDRLNYHMFTLWLSAWTASMAPLRGKPVVQ